MSKIPAIAVLIAALDIFEGASSAHAAGSIERVENCFVRPPEEIAAQIGAFDCGFVVVLENHDNPDDARVKLGFIRLPAHGEASKAPVFMLSGGPGSTLLLPITFRLFSDDFLGPLRENRDIVILEARGSLRSVPAPDCPLLHRLAWMANQFGLDRKAASGLYREVFADCVAQARAHGIDLSQSVVPDGRPW